MYGNVVERHLRDDGTVSVLYHKSQYLYLVIFANGRSVSEGYSRVNGTDLSEKEIAKFLELMPPAGRGCRPTPRKNGASKEATTGLRRRTGPRDERPTLTVRELGGKETHGDL